MTRTLAPAIVVATLVACAPTEPASPAGAAHDFSARQTDGRTFTLHEHIGEVVLLAFFATWSKPSLVELRHLQGLFGRRRADGLLVVGVAVDGPETIADVPAFATRNGLTFPIVLDADSHVVSLYDPKRDVPLSVLLDRNGGTARIWSGYNPGDEATIAAAVDGVLAP